MTLAELRSAFRSGSIDKQDYIARMYELHSVLFEYAGFLAGTEIESIHIADGTVSVQVRDRSMAMRCDPHDMRTAPLEALNFGAYEPTELGVLLSVIEPGSTVFDVGANIGWYSVAIATAVPDVSVLAFEPIPATYSTLVANLERNGCTNVVAHRLGFSDREGVARFFVYPHIAVNASMADHHRGGAAVEVASPVVRLDDFVAEHGLSVDVIKCDVEGAELLVLRGGLGTIETQRPAIFAEMLRKWSAGFDYHPNEIIALLSDVGYRCFTFRQGGGLSEFFTMDDATVHTNFLFLHRDRHPTTIDRLLR